MGAERRLGRREGWRGGEPEGRERELACERTGRGGRGGKSREGERSVRDGKGRGEETRLQGGEAVEGTRVRASACAR